jgi:hypothetical protein
MGCLLSETPPEGGGAEFCIAGFSLSETARQGFLKAVHEQTFCHEQHDFSYPLKKWGNVPKVCLKNLVEPFKPSGRCFSLQNIEKIRIFVHIRGIRGRF